MTDLLRIQNIRVLHQSQVLAQIIIEKYMPGHIKHKIEIHPSAHSAIIYFSRFKA